MSASTVLSLDAVVLAGGRSRRMAGVDKVALELDGRSLLDHAVEAARAAGAVRVVVVGPDRSMQWPAGVVRVREDPPFGGPAAGVAAAADQLGAEWVLLLASDLPHVAQAVPKLLAAMTADPRIDAWIVVDGQGQRQWLLSLVRRESLVTNLAAIGPGNASMRDLFGDLVVCEVPDASGATDDVDTWTDWVKVRARDPLK